MENVLQKLKKAREIIKSSNLEKKGRNDYSKFDYYTPEQVEALVDIACKETNSIILCNLKADEFGLFQTLDFIDLDSKEKISFEMRTKHGSITATNETQQMGGTDTYSERYIKMKVFQIKDNNLDIDSQDNRKDIKDYGKKNVIPKMESGIARAVSIENKKKDIKTFIDTNTPIKPETKKDYEKACMDMFGIELKPENFDEILKVINNN